MIQAVYHYITARLRLWVSVLTGFSITIPTNFGGIYTLTSLSYLRFPTCPTFLFLLKKKSNGNFNLILQLVIIPTSVFMGNSGI